MLIKLKTEYLKEKITHSGIVHKILQRSLKHFDKFDKDKELFFVIGLTRSNRIKYIDVCSMGGLHSTVVGPREVFRRAIVHAAASILVSHNHPSGNLLPSEADKRITETLKEAGNLLDIPVVDHIIFSTEGWYSFSDEGIL